MMFRAASLSRHLERWRDIGAAHFVLDWLENGVKVFDQDVKIDNFSLPNHDLKPIEKQFLISEIRCLEKCGAIDHVEYSPKCISPIGVVPKKKGTFRIITDLRRLNESFQPPKFSNEGIEDVIQMVKADDLAATLDLKNGFMHVPIHPDNRTFFGFHFMGKNYVWNVLPFGFNGSPYYFNKVVRAMVSYIRELGVRIVAYVDDILVLSSSCTAERDTAAVIRILKSLGWYINWDKSRVEPSCIVEYIGYRIDLAGDLPHISIPRQRIVKLKRDIQRALIGSQIKVKWLARIAGQCISMTRAVVPGKLLLRNVYRDISTKSSWSDSIILSDACKRDLNWWLFSIGHWNGIVVTPKQIQAQIKTDASGSGWGAVYGSLEASGHWTPSICKESINYKELLAVHCAVSSFGQHLRGLNVQVLSDNITTVAYINHLGGPCKKISDLMESLWLTAKELNITLTARHYAGKINVEADRLSRLAPNQEWSLNTKIFHFIDDAWGPHSIDRFASFTTALLPRYNSRYWDPSAEAVDGLAQDWSNENNFCNPPWRMLSDVVEKIAREAVTATVIAPMWRGRHWCQELLKMSIRPPIPIPNVPGTFVHQLGLPEPRKNKKWRIYAWRVCGGNASSRRGGRRRLPRDT